MCPSETGAVLDPVRGDDDRGVATQRFVSLEHALRESSAGYTLWCVYPRRVRMKVARWGNSLAVRIPAGVASALDLNEGDEVDITIEGNRRLRIGRNREVDEALEGLRKLAENLKLPPGWKFDRDEIYEGRLRRLSK